MAILPSDRLELIQFCETHIPVWENTPAAIGLTAAQITALSDLTGGARAAYNQAQSARAASKAATTSPTHATIARTRRRYHARSRRDRSPRAPWR